MTLEESLTSAYHQRADYQGCRGPGSLGGLGGFCRARGPPAVAGIQCGLRSYRTKRNQHSWNVHSQRRRKHSGVRRRRIRAERRTCGGAVASAPSRTQDLRGQDRRPGSIGIHRRPYFVSASGCSTKQLDLAQQALQQAQDRFAAGVTNNLEVVQAQEAVATAQETLIASLYTFNAAKAALMRARGESDEAVADIWPGNAYG